MAGHKEGHEGGEELQHASISYSRSFFLNYLVSEIPLRTRLYAISDLQDWSTDPAHMMEFHRRGDEFVFEGELPVGELKFKFVVFIDGKPVELPIPSASQDDYLTHTVHTAPPPPPPAPVQANPRPVNNMRSAKNDVPYPFVEEHSPQSNKTSEKTRRLVRQAILGTLTVGALAGTGLVGNKTWHDYKDSHTTPTSDSTPPPSELADEENPPAQVHREVKKETLHVTGKVKFKRDEKKNTIFLLTELPADITYVGAKNVIATNDGASRDATLIFEFERKQYELSVHDIVDLPVNVNGEAVDQNSKIP